MSFYYFRAEAVLEVLKQNFGANSCFMLSINSKSTLDSNVSMDLWSQYVKRSSEFYVSIFNKYK